MKPTIGKPLFEHLQDEKPLSVKSRVAVFTTIFQNPRPASSNNSPLKTQNISKCEPRTLVTGKRRPRENLMGQRSISCGKNIVTMDLIGEQGPRGGKQDQ